MVSFALHGIGVSGGIAIGRAQLVSHATLEVAHYTIPPAQVAAEIARFDTAIERSAAASSKALHARDDQRRRAGASSARSSTCTG